MNVLLRPSTLPRQSSAIPPGPVTWGLVAGFAAGAAVLLACLSPMLFVAGTAALSVAVMGKAIAHLKHCQREDDQADSWEESAARIAAFVDSITPELDDRSDRFQAMILSQERASRYRVH